MIRLYLTIGILAAFTGLGLYIKAQHEKIDRLTGEKDRLEERLTQASEANRRLAQDIETLNQKHAETLGQIADTEQEKRRIESEMGRENAELRKRLRGQSEWSDARVPVSVAHSVNAVLDRLRTH